MKIRKYNENDIPAIIGLIKDLALFEKAPDKVTNSVERMKNEQEYFNCFVAENNDGEIIGIALYFFAYFTWVGKSLYLDDLYIKPEYRGSKIGTKLLNKIFEVAKEESCQRLRWQVIDWNEPAIKFYKKCGATLDNEWINCDFTPDGIDKFLNNK